MAKKYKQQLQDFHDEVERARQDGYEAILPDGTIFPDYGHVREYNVLTPSDKELSRMQAEESAICGGAQGSGQGILAATNPNVLNWSQYHTGITPDELGTPGLHYVLWGPYNAWPNLIDKAISSNPFLSSIVDYLERTLFGLGPQIVYCITRYSGGTVTHEEVPYQDAHIYLREEIMRLTAKLAAMDKEDGDEPSPEGEDAIVRTVLGNALPNGNEDYRTKLRTKLEHQLHDAESALESYWQTRSQIDELLENNNLTYFYKRWIYDTLRVGICFPMLGLSRSGGGHWDPKIVDIDMRDACTMRLEERDPQQQFRIGHAYYSERWRDDANGAMLTSEMVAYPTIMPEHALRDLRRTVQKNHRTKVGERPSWQCCPSFHPTSSKPIYPQLAWWSIFPSMVYQIAVTSLFDKAAARKNSTLWGKILFINTAYLAQVFNQAEDGKTQEGQQRIRKGIYQSVENFLQDRGNNGKLLVMDSYPSADEKQMIDSVRIVDVPRGGDQKASAQEIAEIASLVSFSFNTNVDLVASRPWSTTSATGTAQRELHLLKNGQLSPDRLAFTDFFNNLVFPFNGYDHHFRVTVPYPTLTTLDASKTGITHITD